MKHLKTLNILNKLLALAFILTGAVSLYFASLALKTGSLFVASVPLLMGAGALAVATFAWLLGNKMTIGQWRQGQIVMGGLSLMLFPLGTLYGAYALWVCLKNDEARAAYQEMSSLEVFA